MTIGPGKIRLAINVTIEVYQAIYDRSRLERCSMGDVVGNAIQSPGSSAVAGPPTEQTKHTCSAAGDR